MHASASSHPTTSTNSLSITRAAMSGAIAGIIADSLLHPLDTINLRMKVQQQNKYASISQTLYTILREEGIRGYFGGLGTTLMLSPICAAIYFGSYETLKSGFENTHFLPSHPSLVYFTAGALSEVVISSLSVPTELIKSRLQLGRNPQSATNGMITRSRNYDNTMHAVRSIVRTEGIRGLYAGYWACLSVDTFFSAFSFLFYEQLKSTYFDRVCAIEKRPINTVESLFLGSASGGLAALITNPFDVVTVRLMTQGNQKTYFGLRHCFTQVIKIEGILGLWRGGLCRTVSIMPSTGICFGIYETIKCLMFDGDMESYPFENASD